MTDPVVPPAQPAYAGAAAPATFPGKTLGIVAIPVAIFFSVVGIILGFVVLVLTIIGWVIFGIAAAALLQQCAGLEPGQYTMENGGTLTCG